MAVVTLKNFIPATLTDCGTTVTASGLKVPVPEAFRAAAAGRDGLEVVLGVRPENVREAGREGTDAVAVTARVEFVEPLGHLIVAKVDPHPGLPT